MEETIRAIVQAIHVTGYQAVFYVTGGASQALGWLMSMPGASNTVLEVLVPYSRPSMIQLLGKVPSQFASRETAEDLALLAYNRGMQVGKTGARVIGLGFTGSLASLHPKRGDHKFYLSTRTSSERWTSEVILSKGLRDREQEDKVSSCFLLMAMAKVCKAACAPVSMLTESEIPNEYESVFNEDQELQQLLEGQIQMKIYPFLKENASNLDRKIILSGSFNPLHEGHLKLLEAASSMFADGYPCFEISAINADKPPLTVAQIKERVKQFEIAGVPVLGSYTTTTKPFPTLGQSVIISTEPYFYKKADLFPGSVFVIGADTAKRLIDPKYYGGIYENMVKTLVGCKMNGCTFLVGGRIMDGTFKVLKDFILPDELKDLFISIPEERFRVDRSSTEIRERLSKQTPND